MKLKIKTTSALEGLIWQAIQIYPIEHLEQFLVDPDERVRMTAARRLQLQGGELAYKMAIKLIQSKHLDLRRTGIFMLGQIQSSDGRFPKRCTPILLAQLKDKSNTIRREAIAALGHLGVDASLPLILKFANSKQEATRVAMALMGPFKDRKTARKALKTRQKDPSSTVRHWAQA